MINKKLMILYSCSKNGIKKEIGKKLLIDSFYRFLRYLHEASYHLVTIFISIFARHFLSTIIDPVSR